MKGSTVTSEDREQGGDERTSPDADDAAAQVAASPLRPDPEWGRPRPTPSTERRFSWGGADEGASGGGPSDPGSTPTIPRTPGGPTVPPPPSGRPPGVSAGPVPPPPRTGDAGRQGGERPARSWATPRIAAQTAGAGTDTPSSDPDAPQLPVDDPVGEGLPGPSTAPTPPATSAAPPPAATPPPPPPPAPADGGAADRRTADRSAVALAELAQQLAATQSQVTSLSAQLTTLAHRITYDLERGAQATSERVLRDLDQLPEQVSFRVGANLGPALDDLTDLVESDSAKLRQLLEGDLAPRLRALGETIDALPLGNVEVLNGLQAIGGDLEDRLTRFATRIADQVTALEAATSAELAKLRTQLEEVQQAAAPSLDQAALERMAGQIERLAERPTGTTEVVDALELLLTEHLDALRDALTVQTDAIPAAVHEEVEAIRTDAGAAVAATEEVLTERIDALESGLADRLDTLLGEQAEVVEALVAERHDKVMAALAGSDEGLALERLEEVAAAVTALGERIDELAAATPVAVEGGGGVDEAVLAGIRDEIKALRRRITLRFEGGDAPPPGLPPEQLKELAAEIARHLT